MSTRALLLLPTLLVGTMSQSPAQQVADLAPGSRIKVSARDRHVGTVLALDNTTLLLRRDVAQDTITIPLSTIRRLQVSTGRRSAVGRGAVIGSLTGGGFGLVLGLASWADEDSFWGAAAIPISVGVFGGVGAVFGTVIGAFSRTDRWQDVPLEGVRIGIAPLGGQEFGISASIAF